MQQNCMDFVYISQCNQKYLPNYLDIVLYIKLTIEVIKYTSQELKNNLIWPFHMQQQKPSYQLNSEKVANMLRLQQLLYNHYLTVELLHELISLYTCAIQSTDESQSELRNYFLEKIQFVLSRPTIQKMLESVNNPDELSMANNLRDTYRATQREQKPVQQEVASPLKKKSISKNLYRYDGENEEQKKKKIDMQFKLMQEVEVNMKNMKKDIQLADSRKKITKQKINGMEKQQNDRLQARLAQRKKNRMRKKSFDQNQQSQEVIPKNQLIKAKQQVEEAVRRITIRMTQRAQDKNPQSTQNTVKTKGRIKKTVRQQDY